MTAPFDAVESIAAESAIDAAQPAALDAVVSRLEKLERQNRRLKFAAAGALAALGLAVAGGLRAAADRVVTDEVHAGEIHAKVILVETAKGVVRIDEKGITLTAPAARPSKSNLTDHAPRIEIGMDYDWSQDNGLMPTPRIAVGRVGHDTSSNLVTRASILSPEGVHSGEWHVNNPKHDGKTDRDMIEDLKKR